jgi:zinc D-Ala-D-Ala carboxypeptidase
LIVNISAHFTIEEVEGSTRAKELGIDNTMPSIYFGNAQNLARFVLEPVRLHFGTPFRPTSWYRCKALNDALPGASKTSDHMIGAAADIAVPKISLMALAEYIRDNLTFDQVILEPKWVHVSYKKDNNRMEVLRKIPGGYAEGLV